MEQTPTTDKEEMMPLQDWPTLGGVPFGLFNQETAERNHGQSLHTLKRRGGLSTPEAIAIILGHVWGTKYQNEKQLLFKLIQGYNIGRAALRSRNTELEEALRKAKHSMRIFIERQGHLGASKQTFEKIEKLLKP